LPGLPLHGFIYFSKSKGQACHVHQSESVIFIYTTNYFGLAKNLFLFISLYHISTGRQCPKNSPGAQRQK
jgi:hypothetical protein